MVKLGFIGFGEAAFGIAEGLKESGLNNVYFYDSFYDTEPVGGLIKKREKEINAIVCKDYKELAENCNIIMSSVIAKVAVDVAKSIRPFLGKEHLYIDSNSASPMVKEEVEKEILLSDAQFVDAALMGPIPAFKNKVPIFASGSGANKMKELLEKYEMNITCIGDKAGAASAIKMFRSIFMKGYVTLLLETIAATNKYNVTDLVLQSIAETMDNDSFMNTTRLLVTRGVIHSERRFFEMNEVIKTMESINVDDTMSKATQQKLKWCTELGFKEFFNGEPPKTIEELLEAFRIKGV